MNCIYMLGTAEEKQDPAISAPLGAAERLCCDFTSSASISRAPLSRVCEAAIRCKGGRCPTPWKMGHGRQELGLGQERRAGGFIQHGDLSRSPGALGGHNPIVCKSCRISQLPDFTHALWILLKSSWVVFPASFEGSNFPVCLIHPCLPKEGAKCLLQQCHKEPSSGKGEK